MTKMTKMTKMTFNLENFESELIHLYLEFTNNFISLGGFASFYGFSETFAQQLIYHGAFLHEIQVLKYKREKEDE